MTRISQQQLESYLWGAATLLRGTIDAGDYKQFIFPLLFYKRLCDVFDEETQAALKESGGDAAFAAYPENHRFQIPQDAHWRETRKAAKNVGQALQSAMRAIETANPEKLYGIFGDAQWTNKDRLSDAMLRDLVEHFSTLELTVANLPEDELGQGYEYLIKKFADDAGHTAAEFYTNRTVVHLMTEMLDVQPSESVYDPTCGSGGMLLSCIAHLRRQGKEWRNVRLYGQERNLMTSSIARMNCFLHGIEDFRIERGDTLSDPKLVEGDGLRRFDVILANPPYSIKQWDREAFASDPWGRNLYGTPPQGRADYAFWQHILCSLTPKAGRCAILFPHGVLFRQEEHDMRRKLIEADLIECVLGLGPNLFYNSPMEACVVICRSAKPRARKGKILLINAVNEVIRERAQSFLAEDNIGRILKAYERFADEPGFTRAVPLEDLRSKNYNLSIPIYVAQPTNGHANEAVNGTGLRHSLQKWLQSAANLRGTLTRTFPPARRPALEPLPSAGGHPAKLPTFAHKSWSRLRFDQIAENLRESVAPTPADSKTYVGLEHMDSGSLHVRRWGSDTDLIGQKLRMRKGDILFARRNAYLRRVAIAPHDGLFSAHGMILRPRPQAVLPEFLPFLMMSDTFMTRAETISVGSLSPTINWSTLRLEEFALPPLDQQRRITEILSAQDQLIERQLDLAAAAATATDRTRAEHFAHGRAHKLTPLRETGHWVSGNTPSRGRPDFWGGSFPWVSPKDMKHDLITDSEEHLTEAGQKEATTVEPGSVLIVIRGMILAHSFPVGINLRTVAFNQDMKAIVPSTSFTPDYLFHWLKWATPKILSRISDSSHGTKRLAMEDLFEMKVPAPPIQQQRTFVQSIQALESVQQAARDTIERLKEVRTTFLNCALNEP